MNRKSRSVRRSIAVWIALAANLVFFHLFSPDIAASAVKRSKLPEIYDELDGDDLLLKLAADGRINELREIVTDSGFSYRYQPSHMLARALILEADGKHDDSISILAAAMDQTAPSNFKIAAAREHLRISIQAKRAETCVVSADVLRKFAQLTPLDHRQIASCYSLAGVRGALRAVEYLDLQIKMFNSLRFHPLILAERIRLWTKLGILNTAQDELGAAISFGVDGKEVSGIVLEFLENARSYRLGRPPFGEQLLARISHLKDVHDREAMLNLEAQRMFALGNRIGTVTRFEQLSKTVPKETKYAAVASELYRIMGWKLTADHIAMSIADSKTRVKLVGRSYLESGQLAKIAAMFPSLDRSLYGGDLNDNETQDWIYLGAFSRLQSGGWVDRSAQGPLHWLKYLKAENLKEKALTLRNLVEDCRSDALNFCEL